MSPEELLKASILHSVGAGPQLVLSAMLRGRPESGKRAL